LFAIQIRIYGMALGVMLSETSFGALAETEKQHAILIHCSNTTLCGMFSPAWPCISSTDISSPKTTKNLIEFSLYKSMRPTRSHGEGARIL